VRQLLVIAIICVVPCFVAAQQPAQSDEPQKVGPTVRAPIPVSTPEASMPQKARLTQKNGICLISLVVDAKGEPVNPQVVRCSDSMFAANSMEAVKKYRFKPAVRVSDGTPVPVKLSIEINFRFGDAISGSSEPPAQLRYAFSSPPGITSLEPDAEGVYALSKRLEMPKISEFVSKGFAAAAMFAPDGTACRLLLTIDSKGKPSNAQILKCDKPSLDQVAIDSLMQSKYKPAKLNGKKVAVRAAVVLVYEGFGPHEAPDVGKPSASSKP